MGKEENNLMNRLKLMIGKLGGKWDRYIEKQC